MVFGDIGTSPLYAFKQAFTPPYGVAVNEVNVLGMLSLIFWTLMITVTIKYVIVMLRADNQGEGGVLSLSTLRPAQPATPDCGSQSPRWHPGRCPVLRRWNPHARDLGAERG